MTIWCKSVGFISAILLASTDVCLRVSALVYVFGDFAHLFSLSGVEKPVNGSSNGNHFLFFFFSIFGDLGLMSVRWRGLDWSEPWVRYVRYHVLPPTRLPVLLWLMTWTCDCFENEEKERKWWHTCMWIYDSIINVKRKLEDYCKIIYIRSSYLFV